MWILQHLTVLNTARNKKNIQCGFYNTEQCSIHAAINNYKVTSTALNGAQYSKKYKNTMWIQQHLTVFNTAINNYKVTSTALNGAPYSSKLLQSDFYNT